MIARSMGICLGRERLQHKLDKIIIAFEKWLMQFNDNRSRS